MELWNKVDKNKIYRYRYLNCGNRFDKQRVFFAAALWRFEWGGGGVDIYNLSG